MDDLDRSAELEEAPRARATRPRNAPAPRARATRPRHAPAPYRTGTQPCSRAVRAIGVPNV